MYYLFSSNIVLLEKSEIYMDSGGLNIWGILSQLIALFPCIFIILSLNNKKEDTYTYRYSHIILTMYLFSAVLGMVCTPFNRITNYFVLLFLIVFTNFISDFRRRSHYKFGIIVSIVILILSTIGNYSAYVVGSKNFRNFQRYYPYSSIIDKELYREREEAIKNEWQ